MAKQRAADEDKVKEDQNKWKKASMIRQRAEDEDKVKEEQNKRSKLSLSKRKADNHKHVKKIKIVGNRSKEELKIKVID